MTTIAFCQSSFGRKSVEEEFRAEHDAARRAGFKTVLIDHDRARLGDGDNVARHLPKPAGPSVTIYRGWMLPFDGYATLYHALDRRGLRLVNDPRQYVFCHHLPNALAALGEATPQTWSVPLDPRSPAPVDELLDLAGTGSVIVKDYVKSEKHMWDAACFIPDVADREAARRVVANFVRVRGDDLEGGLVLRRFEPLRAVAPRGVGGLPAAAEWRTFWLDGGLLLRCPNHEVPAGVELPDPPMPLLRDVAGRMRSRFFTLDVALRDDGAWRIIEPGDGQVAGLPPAASPDEFYAKLASTMP